MPSITEIAVGDERFNVLVNTLQYIDANIAGSDLVGTLNTPGADLTVFAPTDPAFGQLAADLGYSGDTADETAVTTFLVGALPVETLRDVVLYHVSAGAKDAAAVAAASSISTLNGATISPDLPTLVDNEPDLIDPTLILTDVIADNGIIHAIDRVLLPVDLPGNDAPTITGIVAASGGTFDSDNTDFDLLLNAVQTANLAGALDSASADLTVFAPTDAAFIGLAQTLGFSGSDESGAWTFIVDALTLLGKGNPLPLLTDVLTYHVLPESLQASQVLGSTQLTTLQGATLDVIGTSLVDADPDVPDPGIAATDIQASNGIVHVIDGVLLPADLLPSNGRGAVEFIIGGDDRDVSFTGRNNDFVSGNGGNDIISTRAGNDVVLGGDGNDFVFTGGGADFADGGAGRDRIFTKGGDDVAFGGDGRDVIFTGWGNDTVDGGAGKDVIQTGSGMDTIIFKEGNELDRVFDFRQGQDKVDLSSFGFSSFSDLDEFAEGNSRGKARFEFGNDDVLILFGVSQSALTSDDFIF